MGINTVRPATILPLLHDNSAHGERPGCRRASNHQEIGSAQRKSLRQRGELHRRTAARPIRIEEQRTARVVIDDPAAGICRR